MCSPSPRLINMGRVHQQSNLENLEQAFGVAERDLGVTRLLDPEGTTSPPCTYTPNSMHLVHGVQ